jgi:integrase/recombinase XerD
METLPMVSRKALRRWDKAKPPKYLHAEQVRQIIEWEHQRSKPGRLSFYYVLFSVLWQTGARIGEILDTKVEDIYVNAQARQLSIRIKTLKQREDDARYVPIQQPLYDMLSLYARDYGLKSGDRLFDVSKPACHKELKRACKALGFPDWIHIHTFRHSFAVHFLSQGGSINALKDILGHSSIETTMIYLKVFQPDLQAQINKVVF